MTRGKFSRRKRLRRDRPSVAHPSRTRRLRFESFEQRLLLAGDVAIPLGEGEGESLVAIRLQPADPITLQPITSVHQGTEFLLLAFVDDLRPAPAGVFAAYVDINYPDSVFELPAEQPLFYDGDFRNGKAGDVSQGGLVDEFGAFSSAAGVPGSGEQRLGGVRLTATQTGEVTFSTDAADESPFHDFLLFNDDDPLPADSIQHASLTLTVLEPLPDILVDAANDAILVPENSQENLLDVLLNDGNRTGGPLAVTELDTSDTRGEVTIADGGTLLIYTPEEGFVGQDRFIYTASAGDHQDSAVVVINVEREVPNEELVAFSFQITNQEGQPVSAVTIGDDFTLNVLVEDLRDLPEGVFAAYLDVRYTSSAAEIAGQLDFGPAYQNGAAGGTDSTGLIDEAGAFSDIDPVGGGRFRLFSVPFAPAGVGRVIFDANPADIFPEGSVLLYGKDEPVTADQIRFPRTAVDVLPGVIAVDDSFHLLSDQAVELNVLENDVNRGPGSMTITSVDAGNTLGLVEIIAGGAAISYTPDSSFTGSEQFTYTLQGPFGTDTGTITIHRDPGATVDDLVSIELQTTALDGTPIDSINAGEEFLVQALVQDLRGPGDDRGVFATYLDVLYPYANVRPVLDNGGPVVQFDSLYRNGIRVNGSVPGLLDEIGAFQNDSGSLGGEQLHVFSAAFRAAPSQGQDDVFTIVEDNASSLDVLTNDLPNQGLVVFRADPADASPLSDVLLYEPPEPVTFDRIGYRDATINILTDGEATIAGVGATNNGGIVSIAADGLSLLYTPAPNFSGIDRFTYSLDGETPIAVAVTVSPVNDAPVANADHYRGQQGKLLEVGVNRGLLANDGDVDGDALEVVLGAGPDSGQLTLQAGGAFRYQPAEGFVGSVNFTYHVTDGVVDSAPVTVELEIVAKPVSIRLQPVDAAGLPVTEVAADQPVRVQTLIQDLRGSDQLFLGLGSAYLDIAYDQEQISPVADPSNPLGFDVRFDPFYLNGRSGEVLDGRLNDVGAFQTSFSPAGGEEVPLFTAAFSLGGPRAVDDEFAVIDGRRSLLDVLENEAALRWDVSLDAQAAGNSPAADVLYFNPASVVPAEDIGYGDVTFAARNGQLTIDSVSEPSEGGTVSIAGDSLRYSPPAGFVGTDTLTYTVVDAGGLTATATVSIEVRPAWQNPNDPLDVSGDGVPSPLDALIIINFINSNGSVPLDEAPALGGDPIDVNGDGFASPLDALLVINLLATQAADAAQAEGEASVVFPIPANSLAGVRQPDASSTGLSRAASSLDDTIVGSVSPVVSPAVRTSGNRASTVEQDEAEDLLESLATDIAPLWNDLSSSGV